jgi:hypothetical protein
MTEIQKQQQQSKPQVNIDLLQAINIKISAQRNSAHNRIAELELVIDSLRSENQKLKATIEGHKLFSDKKENSKDKK